MTAEQLTAFKHELPFKPVTIHMSNGSKLRVGDPESLVLPKDWTTDAIATFPRSRFSFVYLKNRGDITIERRIQLRLID